MKNFFKNIYVKNILSALAIVVFGFILLNAAFIFDALYQTILDRIIGVFVKTDMNTTWRWIFPLRHGSFIAILLLLSWFIFRSKISNLYKAIYLPVPLAAVYLTMGIFLYRWQIASLSLGSLFFLGVLYYFYRTKQPWLFYFSLIFVSLMMLFVGIFNVDI